MRKKIPHLPIKLVIVIAIISFAIFFIGYLGKVLKNLDYFKIKDIMDSKGHALSEFSYLKGRNIFNIDLRNEAQYLSELYPNYKEIRLIRLLPNRLIIDFIRREPVAYIKLYRYFYVDNDSVLFDMVGELEEPDLPVISGLDTKIFGPKSGKKYNIIELTLALNIIKELKRNKILKDYKIKRIDVVNLSSTSFFMFAPPKLSNYPRGQLTRGFQDIEIKIGQDDIKGKIGTLSDLFIQVKNDWSNIKYIDLRFKEPVIKLKDK